VVTALQSIVSRNVDPLDAAVVSVGTISGGDAFNVIPTRVEMTGTIRTFSRQVAETVRQRLKEVCAGVVAAHGASADLAIESLSPAVINDYEVSQTVRRAAEAVVGQAHVASAVKTTGSEDAAFFMQNTPGCYFFIGSANPERGLDAPHHNPRFDIDEEALRVGVSVFVKALESYL
jgi:amidohydrolase